MSTKPTAYRNHHCHRNCWHNVKFINCFIVMSCLLQSGCQHYSISLQHDESFQDVFDQITYFVMLPLLYLLSQLKEIAINCESFYIAIYVLNWFSFLISCVLSLLLKNQNWEHVDLQFNIIIILYFLKILYSAYYFENKRESLIATLLNGAIKVKIMYFIIATIIISLIN